MSVFVIAEAGVNHNGSLSTALDMVDVAAAAGADAVKFQTFRAKAMITESAPKAEYQVASTGDAQSQRDMIESLELSADAHLALAQHCASRDIRFLSTPFDVESLHLLARSIGMTTIKIPSGEVTNLPFILNVGREAKDVILSSGMCTLREIEMALKTLAFAFDRSTLDRLPSAAQLDTPLDDRERSLLLGRVTVLQCTTEYPAPIEEANLRAMATIRDAFGLAVGYSDHTLGSTASIAAVALGATVIEKHFTLDKTQVGPDHRASLEPDELKAFVTALRDTERALGDPHKVPTESEAKNIPIARKSIVASRNISNGETLSADNLTFKRPGTGRAPIEFFDMIGTSAPRDINEDEQL
jgi:N-acetylneuraminate synthase